MNCLFEIGRVFIGIILSIGGGVAAFGLIESIINEDEKGYWDAVLNVVVFTAWLISIAVAVIVLTELL